MENKHESYELLQMQSLSLSAKIRMSETRIQSWYEAFDGLVYCSISGGKDSQVLAHLVKGLYPDVPLVYVNTGLDNDSVRLNALSMADKVLSPSMDFLSVLTKYGYPVVSKEVSLAVSEIRNAKKHGKTYEKRIKRFQGEELDKNGNKSAFNMEKYKFLLDAPFRISNKCCDCMKKSSSKIYEHETGRHPFLGTMAEESRLRKSKWLKFGCNAFEETRPTSQPLSFWTEQDILQYIKRNDIKIADIYGNIAYTDEDGFLYENDTFLLDMPLTTTGAKRTGCIFCLFGITQDTERFLRLKATEPQKFDYVMRGGCFDSSGMWVPGKNKDGIFGLGYQYVIDWLNEFGGMNIKY